MTAPSLARSGLFVACAALAGCTPPAQKADVAADLEPFRVQAVPDSAHRTFIDFGGKIHLVGYEVSPEGKAGPGSTITAKFYWQPVGALGPGFGLFTHLVDDRGDRLRNFDAEGAFRTWLSRHEPDELALLSLGTIYADEQSLAMPPADEISPEVSVIVGVWSGDATAYPDKIATRLPVVSGPSDGHSAAVIATFETGLTRGARKMIAVAPKKH